MTIADGRSTIDNRRPLVMNGHGCEGGEEEDGGRPRQRLPTPRQFPMPVEYLWMAQPASADEQDQDGPDPPPPLVGQESQPNETKPYYGSDDPLLFTKHRVHDVAPIELPKW